MRQTQFTPIFVEYIPDRLEEGKLYISEKYRTSSHLCACGCGYETVTPLREGGWQISMANDIVTLSPSIGNFNFPCKSHYWIQNNEIRWA